MKNINEEIQNRWKIERNWTFMRELGVWSSKLKKGSKQKER